MISDGAYFQQSFPTTDVTLESMFKVNFALNFLMARNGNYYLLRVCIFSPMLAMVCILHQRFQIPIYRGYLLSLGESQIYFIERV